MKIKLSKIMAAVTALGVTFAGFTAFATPAVYTTTEYTATEGEVKVTSVITGVATKGSDTQAEVTYYVSDGSADADIIYIDQKTAVDGAATFEFVTTEDRLFKFDYATLEQEIPTGKVLSTAKFGSDSDLVVADATFTFHPGANRISQAENVVEVPEITGQGTIYGEGTEDEGLAYTGKVVGNPSKYGIEIVFNDESTLKVRALGCDAEGNFVVVLKTAGALHDALTNKTTDDIYVTAVNGYTE